VHQHQLQVSERQASTHVIFYCKLHVRYLLQCVGMQYYGQKSGAALQVYVKIMVKFYYVIMAFQLNN